VKSQTLEIFAQLENSLINNGSSKERILSCTIYLANISDKDSFNQLWDSWIPAGCAPVRACLEAKLASPDILVELQVVAALL
jgi:enamine deaminase RidA (YjgF/YER057c/UK114 family)